MNKPVKYLSHIWIPMPDGARLGARVWRPENADMHPVPAILEYIPYRKDDYTVVRDATTHPYLATHGYACVRVDMRGAGSSDGVLMDEYSEQEMQDGEDVIKWIAQQNWCDGNIGMIGISWGGITGLQMSSRNADHLKVVVALGATEFRYYDDAGYYLGCMVGQTIGWAAIMFGYNTRPPDPLLYGDKWRDLWMARLDTAPMYLGLWLEHQREDDYWLRGTVGSDYSAIRIPVYAVSGHADCWPNTVSRLLENLSCPRKGLQGAWSHRYPQMAIPGPGIGFMQEVVRWFDHWLKGRENGVDAEPMYRVYMQGSVRPQRYYENRPGRWISEATWPSDQVANRIFYFGDNTLLNQHTAGRHTAAGVQSICSPQTVGLAGGEYMPWFAFGPGDELAGDQQIEDAGSQVFDTGPLNEMLSILGNPKVVVDISSDQPQALLAARICDVWPDGASTLITRGVLNLSQRDSKQTPDVLVPGQRYRVEISLNHIAYEVPPGHRLRVALSTSYWPIAWPAPRAATVSIYAASSQLQLPLRSPNAIDAPAPDFAEPEVMHSDAVEYLRAHRENRHWRTDRESGESVLEIKTDNGRQRYRETGLELDSNSLQRYSICPDDPLSATAHYQWRWSYQRADWHVTTQSTITMSCSETTFNVIAEIIAWEDGEAVFRKSWDKKYPRDHF